MDNKISKKDNTFLDHDVQVDDLYKSLILEIDNFRSYTDITDPSFNTQILNEKKDGTINFGELKKSNTPQESRIHTFYRLIGLPIVSDKQNSNNGNVFFSPGFNKSDNTDKSQKTKLSILKSFSKEYSEGFLDREEYYKTTVIEALKKNYIGSFYILTLFNIRQIDIQFSKSSELFKDFYEQQTFDLIPTDSLGRNLSELKNSDGSFIFDNSSYVKQRSHFTRPLGVDPRIDATVIPSSRRLCQPFLKSKEDASVVKDEYLKKPFIEKIITERFSSNLSKTIFPDFIQQASNYYKDFNIISEDPLFKGTVKGTPDEYKQDDDKIKELRFLESVKKIRGLAFVLKSQKEIIARAQSNNFWLPIVSGEYPDIKFTSSNVLTDDINSDFYRPNDVTLIVTKYEQAYKDSVNNLNNLLSNQKNNDPRTFAFDQFLNFLDSDAEKYSPDKTEVIKNLTKKRDSNISSGNEALLVIEKIMGEFSGLGILDVICLITSLYLIPKESILGLLDDAAFSRCKDILKIPDSQARSGIVESLQELNKQVHAMYTLSEKIILDVIVLNNVR
jgi:hypothetical protein